jgi:hypothetical protein
MQYGLHLCSVHLVDAHYCSDPGKKTLLIFYSSQFLGDTVQHCVNYMKTI